MWFCVNGRFVEEASGQLSLLERGFLWGDGLFETWRLEEGKSFRPQAHWQRLTASAQTLAFRLPYGWETVQEWLSELVKRNGLRHGVIRLTLSRGIRGPEGLKLQSTQAPTFVIEARPLLLEVSQPWKLKLASARRSPTSRVTPHKTLNYLENLLALEEARLVGYDEALFCTEQDWVQEGTRSNCFMLQGEALYTPSLKLGGLPGIMRQAVIEFFCQRFGPVSESTFTYTELAQAEEVFLTNSLQEIIPVTHFEGQSWSSHPRTDTLQQALRDYIRDLLE